MMKKTIYSSYLWTDDPSSTDVRSTSELLPVSQLSNSHINVITSANKSLTAIPSKFDKPAVSFMKTELNNSNGLQTVIDPRFHILVERSQSYSDSKGVTSIPSSNNQRNSQAWINHEEKPPISMIKPQENLTICLINKTGSQICSVRCLSVALVTIIFLLFCVAIALPLILVFSLNKASESTSSSMVSTTGTAITTIPSTSTVTITTPPATAWIPSNYGTLCSSTCINVTTVTPSTLIASWLFETNTNDVSGNGYNGVITNGAAFSTGYIGYALYLDSSLSQYIAIPYINFISQSFTVEMWIYLYALNTSDVSLFGECDTRLLDRCLHYIIRDYKVYMGFYGDDLFGVTNVTTGSWYHLTFVYDFVNNVQSIYLNGLLESNRAASSSYIGQSSPVTLGITGQLAANYYTGLFDQVTVSNRVKTSCEILNDASLIVHYPFDGSIVDIGPNAITATTTVQGNNGISWVTGRTNQAINLNASNSYFQSCGFWALGQNHAYSIALWINPSFTGGTLFHLSTASTGSGGWCLPMIGFSSIGSIVAQTWNGNSFSVVGPKPPINSWTHIVQTWSSANGLRLYINGGLYGSVSVTVFAASGASMCVLLGNSGLGTNCQTGQIAMGSYSGAIDEFYVYNRELTASEVCPLAHP